MIVGQSSGVHKHPSFLCHLDCAIVADEIAAATFEVNSSMVQCQVDGVGRTVVVGPQEGLLIRSVPYHKVHQCSWRLEYWKL